MVAMVALLPACTNGNDDADGGPTTTTVLVPVEEGTYPGLWPYTSAEEADGWTRGVIDETYLDPVRTAREFMRVYGGMTAPVAGEFRPGDRQSGEVEVRPREGSPFVTTVVVRRVAGERSPWVVIGAQADNVAVIAPVALDTISSPVLVSGRSRAFEGTVLVQVKQDGMGPGEFLGQEPLIGGSGADLEPFSGPVIFEEPDRLAGAVVVLTHSAEDGSVEQLSAVRIGFERIET